MDEQRIAKQARPIELAMSDGSTMVGEVFLDLYDAHRDGSQRVGDLLNGEEFFLALRTPEGVYLVNIEQVLEVRVEAEKEKDELMLLGRKHTLRIQTVHRGELRVDLYVDLPQTSSRAKDYFNQRLRFFRVFSADEVIYLNPSSILFIRD